MKAIDSKLKQLRKMIRNMGSVMVAFSGGVDSSVLLAICHEELKENCHAYTVVSPVSLASDISDAEQIAQKLGISLKKISLNELENADFAANSPERCYFCKKIRFRWLKEEAEKQKVNWVVDGTNADDKFDFRPGARAIAELGIASPLKESGLTKNDIRELARHLGLPNWQKPSNACLASRIPYNNPVNAEKLRQIAAAELILEQAGFSPVRVRHHNEIARIEILPNQFPLALNQETSSIINSRLRELGFAYVTLDLQGFRSGSLNETLNL